MSNVERAVSFFLEGFVCSQAILSTYGSRFGLNRELALKISAPFGGGISRMAITCGAVTGALMVIGLKHGYVAVKERNKKEKMYDLTKEFVNRFKSRNKTIKCKELLDCDISTKEGLQHAHNNRLFIDICPKFVRDSAEILDELLQENP